MPATKARPKSYPAANMRVTGQQVDTIDWNELSDEDKRLYEFIKSIPDEVFDAEECRRSFARFVQMSWHVAEPGSPLIWGWHMQAICDHLQACAEGQIKNLVIAVPPRHSKSSIVAVLFTAWVWIRWPGKRLLFVSFAARLSNRDSRKCRNLIESEWYQKRFGHLYALADDSNTIIRFDNDKGGMRFASSVDGTLTGEGANFVIADDLHNISEIHSDIKRVGTNDKWDQVLSSRLNPPVEEGHFIVIAQRGHDDDLIGHIKRKDKDIGNYVFLELPAEYDPDEHCVTKIGVTESGEPIMWEDPRREKDELLWPVGCPKKYLDEQKINLGAYAYAAQYQQRPVPKSGGIFEMHWFQRYTKAELINAGVCDDSCISVDMNFGSDKKNDHEVSWVVATAWKRFGARFYLIDIIRGQWKYTEAKREILKFIIKHGDIWAKYVENKANGPAIIDDLTETEGMSGMIPIDPKDWGGDKKSRAYSVTPLCEAKNVYLPDEDHEDTSLYLKQQMMEVLRELATFPLGSSNDIVDSITQALNKMRSRFIAPGVSVGQGEMSIDQQIALQNAISSMQVVPGIDVPKNLQQIPGSPGGNLPPLSQHPVVRWAQGHGVVKPEQTQEPQEQFHFPSAEVEGEGNVGGVSRSFGGIISPFAAHNDHLLQLRANMEQESNGASVRRFWGRSLD